MPRRLLKFGTALRSRIVMIASDGGSIRRPRPGVGTWAGSGRAGFAASGFPSSAGTGGTDGTRSNGGRASSLRHSPLGFLSEKTTDPAGFVKRHLSGLAVDGLVAPLQHAMGK